LLIYGFRARGAGAVRGTRTIGSAQYQDAMGERRPIASLNKNSEQPHGRSVRVEKGGFPPGSTVAGASMFTTPQ